jgi:hypothetical protein
MPTANGFGPKRAIFLYARVSTDKQEPASHSANNRSLKRLRRP